MSGMRNCLEANKALGAIGCLSLTLIRPSGTISEKTYRVVQSRLLGESKLLASTSRERDSR